MGKKSAPKMGNRPTHKSETSKPRASAKRPPGKRAGKQAAAAAEAEEEVPRAPVERQASKQDTAHQQKLLGIFQDGLASVLTSSTLNATLQEVKTALFNRDFDTAFGREDFLEAYAARWSPTRALCYDAVLRGIAPHLDELLAESVVTGGPQDATLDEREAKDEAESDDGSEDDSDEDEESEDPARVLRVLSIGGAAAEVIALGSHLSLRPSSVSASVALVDMAPWSLVVDKLLTGLATPPPLSAYTSAAARARNAPLVSGAGRRLKDVKFTQADVLTLDRDGLAGLVREVAGTTEGDDVDEGRPILVTLLFTLNELFTLGGVGKTTAFLLGLTSVLPRGSLLLVVDSPGSYSETTVGKEAKRYPMQWLMDRILLRAEDGDEEDGEEVTPAWSKVEEKESVWFRLGQGLRYPIPLEDMRYQMHLYRRGGARGGEDEGDDDAE